MSFSMSQRGGVDACVCLKAGAVSEKPWNQALIAGAVSPAGSRALIGADGNISPSLHSLTAEWSSYAAETHVILIVYPYLSR